MHKTLTCLLLIALSACSTVDRWLGAAEEPPLEGERFSVLKEGSLPEPSDVLAERPMRLGAARKNHYWSQRGGNAMNDGAHLAGPVLKDEQDIPIRDRIEVGDSEAWETSLVIPPVIWKDRIIAMDAAATVSAFKMTQEGFIPTWQKKVDDTQEEPMPGGGMALAGETVFAVTGKGLLAALNVKNGQEYWKRELNTPVRIAPRVAKGMIFLTTVDNQLFAIDATDGSIRWKHQGIQEIAGVHSAPMVAVRDEMVIVPYSSGELYAVDARNGNDRWRETLMTTKPTAGRSRIADMVASPIIHEDRVYVGSQAGVLAAIDLRNGARLWEEELPGIQHMWRAGGYLFITTMDRRMLSVYMPDGRIRWTQTLPGHGELEPEGYWIGSLTVSGQLLVFGSHGEVLKLNPADGAIVSHHDYPSEVMHVPSVVNGGMFAVSRDATLYWME